MQSTTIDSKMLALNWMSASAFVPVNKLIARKYGLDFAVLLAEAINQYKRWLEQGKLQEDMFFWTEEDCEMETTLKKGKQAKIFKEMEEQKLLKRHTKKIAGGKTTRYIHIFWDAVVQLMFEDDQHLKDKIRQQIETRKEKQKIHKKNFVLKRKQDIKIEEKPAENTEVPKSNFPEVPKSNFGKFQNGTPVINITSKKYNTNNNNKNLNLNLSEVDKYKVLYDSTIPHDLKTRIKIMIADNIIDLSANEILMIEDAYQHQLKKGFILPNGSKEDATVINDYEFSLTVSKMLNTVKEINNMRGLIQTWVKKALDYKLLSMDKLDESKFYNWLED